MNVRANLGSLKDAAFVSTVGEEADHLELALEDIAAEALRS
jgi:formiminotetrahydrofolate cyclodeaminase